jgi:hypothetical protein
VRRVEHLQGLRTRKERHVGRVLETYRRSEEQALARREAHLAKLRQIQIENEARDRDRQEAEHARSERRAKREILPGGENPSLTTHYFVGRTEIEP